MRRIAPERRTRVDLVVSAVIVVVVLVVGVVVWSVSPVRHADSAQASAPAPEVAPATAVPRGLRVAWTAQSGATTVPAVSRSVVVSADHGTVVGHDPTTGRQLWRYERNLSLCSAVAAWPSSSDEVLAAYRNSRGCSEVTALASSTGQRKGARTSDADDNMTLVADSGYVLALGDRRLETWGSNLVRGIEYGRVSAPVKPGTQPGRVDCRLYSGSVSGDRVAVIERCENDPGYRLTVLGAVLDSDEKVKQYGSSLITDTALGPPPVVVAMSTSAIAVYDGGADPSTTSGRGDVRPEGATIRGFDSDGAPGPVSTVQGPVSPPSDSVALTSEGLVTFFTGSATIVLDGQTMRPIYQVPQTLGPGETMAGQLLLPTGEGISVRDPATGRETSTIGFPRDDATATTSLRVIGNEVVEQHGSTIRALVSTDPN
ncbi:hypothetical protein LK459_16900 [Gordonia otitidis]|uniref:Rv3212 family protein n=1 Tax=Gordonia otitidis TaxID=249058 RepID=UPI001D140CC5|nr:hypothetical protein [Gordonia otitidis]UEA58252.1 hypothetical protein LK459_16900 [Gordonia otitidis]